MSVQTARTSRSVAAVLVALSMTAGILAVAVIGAKVTGSASAPVYLEPATNVGQNPFVPATAQPAGNDIPTTAGTGDLHTCDPAKLIDYLTSHPDAAAAWVAALNSDPTLKWSGGNQVSVDQIPDYIRELTPAVLSEDMRVTNYQFVGGKSASVQSVLQKDTAVLMDSDGVPRARCACGNPLTPAKEISNPVEYVGEPWSDFTPVVVVHDDDNADDGDHPSCDDDQYWDGDRCRDVRECPPNQSLGDDGRCHYPHDPCPQGWDRNDQGRCYDPNPHYCKNGDVERQDKPCPPPLECKDGEHQVKNRCVPDQKPCPDGVKQGSDGKCPPPPPCVGTESADKSKPCTPPDCSDASATDKQKCQPKPPTCVEGSAGDQGSVAKECVPACPEAPAQAIDQAKKPVAPDCAPAAPPALNKEGGQDPSPEPGKEIPTTPPGPDGVTPPSGAQLKGPAGVTPVVPTPEGSTPPAGSLPQGGTKAEPSTSPAATPPEPPKEEEQAPPAPAGASEVAPVAGRVPATEAVPDAPPVTTVPPTTKPATKATEAEASLPAAPKVKEKAPTAAQQVAPAPPAAVSQPAPAAPKTAPKVVTPAPTPVAKAAPKVVTPAPSPAAKATPKPLTCPNGTTVAATKGCPVPTTGVPAGWVVRSGAMFPAAA